MNSPTSSPSLDWEPLRERMLKHGVRNATLMAIAPVESSSVVIDSTNGIEMPMELISVKESKAGSFVQVVPEYKKLKNKYQLMWEQTDCVDYIKTAAVLAAFCDQSISTNTFYSARVISRTRRCRSRSSPRTSCSLTSGASRRSITQPDGEARHQELRKRRRSRRRSSSRRRLLFDDEEDCEACKL
jgi:ribonucleotide reductase alpha subunit